ncbi:sulfite exporter TauE/SafE family protein [Allopusillimonas ginsengisoli]|uniref:sulfite exporter TauE/SafE family protein n=1 Tax=Allopusillimonas ginsengisoli TaxID=453575 RepID=UPI001022826A|nr:sulfite exporter TauE/SafE family protein [Allopusillimonas ginsengisoli]TEA78937.1 sulfite exporter TauE/SafE family protein [Allopusillimonas ginsengisoli]
MIPGITVLVPFILIVVAGVYFQTVTGFGLSMIVMGMAGGMGVASVATLASVVSIVALVNSAVALRGTHHHINWRLIGYMVAGVLPASVLGVIVLDFLSDSAADIIQLLLGLVIAYGGINFAWRPKPLTSLSGRASFVYYGFLGGLIGGMFGIPGPPLIFHLYRQPMTLPQIRGLLIFINAVVALARTLFVGAQGQLGMDVIVLSAVCLPMVAIATVLGKRFPPPLSADAMRRLAFAVLVIMGMALMLPVLLGYWNR